MQYKHLCFLGLLVSACASDAGVGAATQNLSGSGYPFSADEEAMLDCDGDLLRAALPATTSTTSVSTSEALSAALATANSAGSTRINIASSFNDPHYDITLTGAHIHLSLASGATLGDVYISRSAHHILIEGGNVDSVSMAVPSASCEAAEDITIQAVNVRPEHGDIGYSSGLPTDANGIEARGSRIVLTGNSIIAPGYAVWSGDVPAGCRTEDIIVEDNEIAAYIAPLYEDDIGQAVVRFHDVWRSSVERNFATASDKHVYRVHSSSRCNYFGENYTNRGGIMLGDADEPDALTHQTVSDNVVCMSNADLFNPEAADVQRLVAHNNQAFSDEPSHTQFCTGTGCTPPTPTSWDLSGNTVGAFAGNTWCSHTYPSP